MRGFGDREGIAGEGGGTYLDSPDGGWPPGRRGARIGCPASSAPSESAGPRSRVSLGRAGSVWIQPPESRSQRAIKTTKLANKSINRITSSALRLQLKQLPYIATSHHRHKSGPSHWRSHPPPAPRTMKLSNNIPTSRLGPPAPDAYRHYVSIRRSRMQAAVSVSPSKPGAFGTGRPQVDRIGSCSVVAAGR